MAGATAPTAQDGLTMAGRTRRSRSRALRRGAARAPGGWRGLPYERRVERVFELMTSGDGRRVAFQR